MERARFLFAGTESFFFWRFDVDAEVGNLDHGWKCHVAAEVEDEGQDRAGKKAR